MKRIFFLASILLIAIPAHAQTNTFPSSGAVGIGTTSPTSNNLVIYDNTNNVVGVDIVNPNTGSVSQSTFRVGNSSTPYMGVFGWAPSGSYSNGDAFVYATSGIGLRFYTNGNGGSNTQMMITSSGNVGIGTATPVVGGGLTIMPLAVTSGTPSLLTITGPADTGLTASTEANDVNFNLNRTVTFATGNLTTQRAIYLQAPTYAFAGASTITNAATLDISGPPVAGTNATITNPATLIIESGKVGIGTARPQAQLDVLSTSNSVTRGIASYQVSTDIISGLLNFYKARGSVTSETAVATNDYTGSVNINAYDGSNYLNAAGLGARVNGTVTTGTVPLDLYFYTTGGVNDTDPYLNGHVRMVISSGGNVGIDTTSPQATLDINGFARLALNSSAPATCSSSNEGAVALTHLAQVCVCDTTPAWHLLNTSTACSW